MTFLKFQNKNTPLLCKIAKFYDIHQKL